MKHRKSRRVGRRFLSIIVSLLVPIIGLQMMGTVTSEPLLLRFLADFLVAELAVEIGILIAKPRSYTAIIEDLFIAGVTGIGAWIATRLSLAQGGAQVDPGLLALFTAYILWLWPHTHRRGVGTNRSGR
ncbi:MAG: hypothetical protein M1596_06425 [Firmicutes bacterium]|nr:hypothetical protein [Bacillota bacterium]